MIALLLLMIVKMGTVPILIMGTVPIFSDTATIQLHSRILNEKRTLYVSLPEDYKLTRDSYPVLYVLDADGRSLFPNSVAVVRDLQAKGLCPEMILIGIWNTQRNRRYHQPDTATRYDDAGDTGEARLFGGRFGCQLAC